MRRVKENNKLIEKMPEEFQGGCTEVSIAVQFQILTVLKDISKSLALIADSVGIMPDKEDEDDGR